MPLAVKHASPHLKDSSVVSLLSGWAQQGVQTFFATQRILLDLAMRQNASVMHAIRQQLTDPLHSPTAILGDVAAEGFTNFMEGQKVLLDLGKQQNEILATGLKQRLGDRPRGQAMVDLLRRSVGTFIHMQEEYLKIAGKQVHTWIDAAKAGKPYQPEHLVDLAREAMDNFVHAQKQYLDIVAEETAKAAGGKRANSAAGKTKPVKWSELARKATESLIEAQKRLVDVAGQQLNANAKAAGKTIDLLPPFPFLPLNELIREAVKSYVEAQKALMGVMMNPARKVQPSVKKPTRKAKAAAAVA